jgi:hypothetical protein
MFNFIRSLFSLSQPVQTNKIDNNKIKKIDQQVKELQNIITVAKNFPLIGLNDDVTRTKLIRKLQNKIQNLTNQKKALQNPPKSLSLIDKINQLFHSFVSGFTHMFARSK